MADIKVCTIGDEVKEKMRKFRFRKDKTNGALIFKINLKEMAVQLEEELDDITVEEMAEELPEFSPRFIAFSYCHKHDDGRLSFPLVFIHYCPGGVKPEHNMVYAGTKPAIVQASGITKSFEMRSVEDLTEEWLLQKLGFFN